jgi:proliferating cell nuclear antigen
MNNLEQMNIQDKTTNSEQIIKLKTEHALEMKYLFEILGESVSDVNLTFLKDKDRKGNNIKGGLKIFVVDDHQIILIKLNFENFSEFYSKYDSFNVGINLKNTNDFFKLLEKDHVLAMKVNNSDNKIINFELHNPITNNTITHRQNLLVLEEPTKKLPKETEFETTVLINTTDFKKAIQKLSQYSDYIEIICTNKTITFKTIGGETDLPISFNDGDCNSDVRILHLMNKKNPLVKGIYSLKHIKNFANCDNLCNELQLYLKNSYPLFIHYFVGSLGKMLVGLSPLDEKLIMANEKILKDKPIDKLKDEPKEELNAALIKRMKEEIRKELIVELHDKMREELIKVINEMKEKDEHNTFWNWMFCK